jgi:tetratricopeptide (TPR) repeat protein
VRDGGAAGEAPAGAGAPPARVARLIAAASAAAVFLLIACFCLTRATDTDLWWHLAAGDLVRRTGEVPRADPFSYTAAGRRWVDIHWLFQVAASFAYEHGGLILLTVLKTSIILALFAVLFVRGRLIAPPWAVGGVLLLAAVACQERFLLRPEIVSWLFLAVTIAALERALHEPAAAARRRILWLALPALQCVWVNVQGLFILGPAMAGLALLTAIVAWARAPAAARDRDLPIDFLVGLAAMAVAVLANPYGAAALRLPFEQLFGHLGGRTLLSRTIAEFQPPLSGYLVTPSIRAFVLLAALTGLALLGNARRVRLFDLLVAAAAFGLALKARRNIPIFAVAAAQILLRNAVALRGARGPGAILGPRRAAAAAAAAPLLVAAAALYLTFEVTTNRFFLRRPTERWWGVGAIPDYFPEAAARLLARGTPGQVFHSLAIGGFLIHAWGGERRVFIDGRNDPYLDGVLETYLKAIADPAAFEEAVRRYQITAVLWPHQRALEGRALLAHLARRQGWVEAYLDPAAVVYLRADVATPEILGGPMAAGESGEAERAGPGGPGRPEVYEGLARRLEERPFAGPPIREIALGEFFSASGDPQGAAYFLERALRRLPGSPVLLQEYGLALERLGRIAEARAAHEAALAAEPGFLPSAAALGALLLEAGRVEEAERLLGRAYEGGDRSVRLLLARARLFDRRGDARAAVGAYREAVAAAPREVALLLDVARFYARHREADAALAFYAAASEANPDDPATAGEMAEHLAGIGRVTAALDVARDGARRALQRVERGVPGAGGAPDRRLIVLAARLEARAGSSERAAEWIAALERTGLLRDGDLRDAPELRPPVARPRR